MATRHNCAEARLLAVFDAAILMTRSGFSHIIVEIRKLPAGTLTPVLHNPT
jgi:hypothetical protein